MSGDVARAMRIISESRPATAAWRNVTPEVVLVSESAPQLNRSFTVSLSALWAAYINGVAPRSLSRLFALAPASRKSLTASKLQKLAEYISPVTPSGPDKSGFTPPESNVLIVSRSPKSAERGSDG